MLSVGEQKTLVEPQRRDPGRVEVPRPRRSRPKAPLAFVVLWWFSVLAVIVGANLPALGMAAAVGLGWLLLRYLPGLEDTSEAASDPAQRRSRPALGSR